jgi:DNA-binding response OmpR family regulator
MNKQTRERVFDRFFQGNSGSNQEGMGIGLAIAREMIEIHGGTLTVESELGMGTTFTFTMPLGCDHLDPDDIDIAETPEARPHTIGAGLSLLPADLESPEADSSTGPRPRLLLVEDNADMRAYLRMHLDFHYAVREAESGLAAIDALTEELPDIILSDVMMPGLNGIELCRKIKAEAAWKAIPIILLSAKASIDYRLEGLKAGADDYQPKPFSVSELLERLKSRLPAKSVEAIAPDEPWSQKLLDCIDEHMGSTGFNVQTLARKMGYSDRQLQRRVVERFGKTPAAFLLERRLENAHTAINNREFSTVAEVAQAVGLSPGYFSRRYRHAYRCDAVLFASPTAEGGEFSREG